MKSPEQIKNLDILKQMMANGFKYNTADKDILESWSIKYECDNDDGSICAFANGRSCYKYYIFVPTDDVKGWCGFKDRFIRPKGYVDFNILKEFNVEL